MRATSQQAAGGQRHAGENVLHSHQMSHPTLLIKDFSPVVEFVFGTGGKDGFGFSFVLFKMS